MILSSSFENRIFDDFDDLFRFVNEHVDKEEYAVVLKRTKKFKLRVKCKTWMICDREKKSHECTKQNRRHDDSRHIECFFFIVIKLSDENADFWIFEIKNEDHNHVSSIVDAHSVLRRMTMTREMKIEIRRQLTIQMRRMNAYAECWMSKKQRLIINTIQVASFKIISIVRLFTTINLSAIFTFDSITFESVSFDFDSAFINFLIKTRDVYNIKAQMRRDELESMTSIQALMHQLDENDWTYAFQKDRLNQVTHLFFAKKSSQSILKINYEVFIMNCIYKINRYKMSLMIIFDQTVLHKTFYVVFCFMTKKKQNDYV